MRVSYGINERALVGVNVLLGILSCSSKTLVFRCLEDSRIMVAEGAETRVKLCLLEMGEMAALYFWF